MVEPVTYVPAAAAAAMNHGLPELLADSPSTTPVNFGTALESLARCSVPERSPSAPEVTEEAADLRCLPTALRL